ncbi:MAG: PHP domain-containing protein [Dehalococcoidia bacterium]|nr:PHP domain-containing protein [Dehalococcoidia bacterium]
MMILDLHTHTTKAGPHSSLDPVAAIVEAKRIGLDGFCVTEHEWTWEKRDAISLSNQHGFPVFRGIEVNTDLGHIAVFGLERYIAGIYKLATLRQVADDAGAFLIALHPFRRVFDAPNLRAGSVPTVEEAALLPLFQYVDDIEVLNGANSDVENEFALKVGRLLGMRGTGGSDAHSTHGLGCCTTLFERDIASEEDLLDELRAGRFRPAAGLLTGELVLYGVAGAGY